MCWPNVGNRFSNCATPIKGDAALHVDPEDTEELTFALKTLTEQDGLRRKLSEMGMARAAQFSWETAVDQTWDVYKELF